MLQDPYSSPSSWSADDGLPAAREASPSSVLRPLRPGQTVLEPVSADTEGGRLHRLLWIFALLTVVLVAGGAVGHRPRGVRPHGGP
jgi:hypothetical protein